MCMERRERDEENLVKITLPLFRLFNTQTDEDEDEVAALKFLSVRDYSV